MISLKCGKIHHGGVRGEKWKAFGWNVIEIDGHRIDGISDALQSSKENQSCVPTIIIARTIKGQAVERLGDNPACHPLRSMCITSALPSTHL